jgi:protein-arginine deiminase
VLTIFADLNHAEPTDARGTSVERVGRSNAFSIVPLIPREAAASFREGEGFRLAGATQPIPPASIRIRLNTWPPEDAKLLLEVNAEARGRVCLFRRSADGWESLGLGGTWQLEVGRQHEFDLGLAATPPENGCGSWARTFRFEAALVTVGPGRICSAGVRCEIPPLILTSSLEVVEEVLVVRNRLSSRFVAELEDILAQTGVRLHAVDFNEVPDDLWIQDAVSIGRVPLPTRRGEEQLIAVLGGLRSKSEMVQSAPLDRHLREHFRRSNALLFEAGEARDKTAWIDWYGNLQVSPPVKDRSGRAFPFGRILTGRQGNLGMHPEVLSLLEMQSCQWPPVVIDVSWLRIGHVDEVVNFVPAADAKAFRVLIPSPLRARTILERLVNEGHAEAPVFTGLASQTTAARLLEEIAASEENRRVEAALRQTRFDLCRDLGIEDEHFVKLPVLFERGIAVFPNAVNSLVCQRQVIVPDPAGPLVGGCDAFAEDIRRSLESLELQTHFINSWEPLHARGGEIHCGTNAVRRWGGAQWWRVDGTAD